MFTSRSSSRSPVDEAEGGGEPGAGAVEESLTGAEESLRLKPLWEMMT